MRKQNETGKKGLFQTRRKWSFHSGMFTAEFSGGKAGRNTALKEISLKNLYWRQNKMNKAEIINGLEDLVRSTKSSLDYSPSDDVFFTRHSGFKCGYCSYHKMCSPKSFSGHRNTKFISKLNENFNERL